MSEANSRISLKPASTIVGCRRAGSTVSSTATSPTCDEAYKREKCAWFETQLDMTKYLRDKKNEERAECGERFVRVNSKLLRCSYRIPAEDVSRFLKTLHTVLAPGFRVERQGKSAAAAAAQSDYKPNDEEKRSRRVLYNWIVCSDLTAQVFPKAPTVLWIDLECMVCKTLGRRSSTHFSSKGVIEIVVGVVLKCTDTYATSDTCEGWLYVTRGQTCGMHLFFPQVVLNTEHDVQEVWAAVNADLTEKQVTAAVVDTGCSAMPLPLARNHNGLTRVEFKRNGGGELCTKAYQIENLSVRDLASVTNFCHFATDFCKDRTPSPSSSVVVGTTDVADTTEVAPVAETAVVAASETEIHEGTVTVPVERSEESEHPTDTTCTFRTDERLSDERSEPTTGEIVTMERDVDDERASPLSSVASSVSSGSSKRLVQTDIRAMCAKANLKKRKSTSSEGSSQSAKRQKHISTAPLLEEPILIDDDDNEFEAKADDEKCNVPCKTSDESTSEERDTCKRSVAVSVSREDDTVSSFLCMGYNPPSLKSADFTASSLSPQTVTTSPPAVNTNPPPLQNRTAIATARLTSAVVPPHALYVVDETPPTDARLPVLMFKPTASEPPRDDFLRKLAQAKESFENSMKLHLDGHENQMHETDIQLIVSSFKAEMSFYSSVVNDSMPVTNCGGGGAFDGLRMKDGCSLHESRENCPPAMFPEHVPFVLYSEDFVTEGEWITVLVRYFDEYLNNAPFLYVMSRVLQNDDHVKKALSETSRERVYRSVHNCLSRFKYDAIGYQKKQDALRGNRVYSSPKHPYEEKCTVVVGLMAVCSLAYKMVTPVFTDLAKVCRLLLGNNQQTLDSLNSSTMSTANAAGDSDCFTIADSLLDGDFHESVSQCDMEEKEPLLLKQPAGTPNASKANIGNDHSIVASALRWNYPAMSDQTLWCLFFYYYHVHADGLTRIMDEVVHGGLMVTALLQAHFENLTNNEPVNVRTACSSAYAIHEALTHDENGNEEENRDRSLMPPPSRRGGGAKKTNSSRNGDFGKKKKGYASSRDKAAGRSKVQDKRRRRVEDEEGSEGSEDGESGFGDEDDSANQTNYLYKTSFNEVLSMIVSRYLRPVSFDETTVVYTEAGYEQCQNEYSSFFSADKDRKRTATDVFTRTTLKYSMPHGDLLLYNTDVMGTVHRRSSCTNNLVLNVFENMYGGCMSFLTRRFNNHLKLFNRFNGDAYLLVVECRHAMNELVRSIELSYINLILRQPVVPPVLEADIGIRHMFMSDLDVSKGAFVCLNAMDYVRSINMFTRHAKFSQENCKSAESFLNDLITGGGGCGGTLEGDACTRFRTIYLFYLLYVFEVLYKIRHAYSREGSYRVSVERLSWDLDVRVLLRQFFGAREFRTPRGLSPEALKLLDLPPEDANPLFEDDRFDCLSNDKAAAARCINTRPLVSTTLPDRMSRMAELFGKKGLAVMKCFAPLGGGGGVSTSDREENRSEVVTSPERWDGTRGGAVTEANEEGDRGDSAFSFGRCDQTKSYEELDRKFMDMTQTQLEEALYSSAKWYENCRVRVEAVNTENRETTKGERDPNGVETSMDEGSMDTFLRTLLRVHIDNDRLNQVERAVREKNDFAFCANLPLRAKMMALVLATHTIKRLTSDVAAEFVHKEYNLERSGAVRCTDVAAPDRPDREWERTWKRLLSERKWLLAHCRAAADSYFPNNYFVGLEPENTYYTLYNYMLERPKYVTLHALQNCHWAKDVCAAINYLLVINAYDPELVELCLRLFLGFEWPGQWAKRIFVWKSNSNAGKSFFFEHVIRKAFDQSTCINDPKGGKENAPEKSEYYKNFVLTINEFTSASAGELKKLCSTSSYKFRMNFGNQMIQAFMVGKMVFNCNTLPLTTDHATIQRVALVPLPFWFQKRQTVVDSMLNWTRGQSSSNEYEKKFRRNVSRVLTATERRFFLENRITKNEDDLFNRPNETSLQLMSEVNGGGDRNTHARASMFLVQNKTSQVYMLSAPPTGTIISGIMLITRYFCRFRFFNNIKEPVDYSVLPTACNAAAQEWQRISQPYFDWKERYRVYKDYSVRTKVSAVHTSLNHFAKSYAKNASFFDLKQFFEWDFAEHKIPYYNAREDEYNVRLDPLQD